MSLNESIVEDAMRRVKSEIGRVKSWSSFPISLFTLHSSSREAIRRLNPAIPEEAREEALRKVLRVGTPALTKPHRPFTG